MKLRNFFFSLIGLAIISSGSANAQTGDPALTSITASELQNHIYFLASDFLKGRVATTPEYEIAAQYVASQFAASGVLPAIKDEDGNMSYLQGVPFATTIYSDKLEWKLSVNDLDISLTHKEDFKIMFGRTFMHEDAQLVWAGYGIQDTESKWDDFKDLDVSGKIVVIMSGAPMKRGKPVLDEETHEKFTGSRGVQSKLFSGLFRMDAAGIIVVDIDGSSNVEFDTMPSSFSTKSTGYKSNKKSSRSSFPTIYVAKPEFLNLILGDQKNNPLNSKGNILKNYQTQMLEGISLNSEIEIISEDIIPSNNVVGIVPGTDPVLKNEYIVVGAHLDHVKPRDGQVCNGADDNASGSSGVMEVAEAIALNPCKRSVVFIAYTAEEMGLIGSRHFVASEAYPKDQIKFNINLDMIGRTSPKNEDTRAHYAVTNKRYLHEINSFINEINNGVTNFPIIIDDDETSPGGSDHQNFIGVNIPAFFFFSGMHEDLHQPGDDAEKIDYPKAESLCKLSYLMTQRLANMETVPTFLKR